ncbi:MAG: PIG-L family deacetylase [Anaerolineales bacterium]|nr:PIG-L family deacetylase [Anaerolineales bacterium]
MNWIYLSPHFDDIALSCGGLLWEQVQAGESASIWTICAGAPPPGQLSDFASSLHARWEALDQAVEDRRSEDLDSCTVLGASYRHFSVPDCIYRRGPDGSDHLYTSEEALFGPLHPAETILVQTLQTEITQALKAEAVVVCPLALGGHVDHRLVRAAAEGLGRPLWYYADYPYVIKDSAQMEALQQAGWQPSRFRLSAAGLAAWQDSIAAHQSQISTFWPDLPAMQADIAVYAHQNGGLWLWQAG